MNTSTIVYEFHGSLYINLTNRCTMACTYCIKNKWQWQFEGSNLKLDRDPSAAEVIAAIGDPKRYREIIFCGYGDALIRLDEVKEISRWVKAHGGFVRINTAGHANVYHKRDIAPELAGLVDAISVSLNGSNPDQYVELNRPAYGKAAWDAAIEFVRACARVIPEVTITAVAMPGVDTAPAEAVARELKVRFRLRPYLEEEAG